MAPEDSGTQLVLRHGNATFNALAVDTVFFYPVDTLKTLLQVSANAGKRMGLSAIVDGVGEASGMAGLYGGAGWHLLGRIPALGMRFGVYELVTAYFLDGRQEKYVSVSEAFLAGLVGGSLECIVSTPFEFLKVRAQVTTATTNIAELQKARRQPELRINDNRTAARWSNIRQSLSLLPNRPPDLIQSLKAYPWLATGSGQPPLVKDVGGIKGSIQLEGWKAFWTGLRPGLFRDALYSGCFFSGWQYLDDLIAEWKAYRMDPPPSSWEEVGPSSPLQVSMTAGLAASFAAVATHTFDSAKVRAQATVSPKYLVMERKLLKWKMPGTWLEKTFGFNPLDRPFLRRGMGVRALQHGLGAFALVLTYNTSLQTALAQKSKSSL